MLVLMRTMMNMSMVMIRTILVMSMMCRKCCTRTTTLPEEWRQGDSIPVALT